MQICEQRAGIKNIGFHSGLFLLAMFFFPVGEQIRSLSQTPHQTIDVLVGHRLQNDSSKLVLQKIDSGPCFNPMLASELHWHNELSL